MNPRRRHYLLGLSGVALIGTGCAARPLRPANPDGTYCYEVGKSYHPKRTCTSQSIPTDDAAADARTLEGVPDRLTIYVVRSSWSDVQQVVKVEASGMTALETVPESFARLRLPPGRHRLALIWGDGRFDFEVQGRAADTVVVEVRHQIWGRVRHFYLESGFAQEAARRVAGLKFVADLRQ